MTWTKFSVDTQSTQFSKKKIAWGISSCSIIVLWKQITSLKSSTLKAQVSFSAHSLVVWWILLQVFKSSSLISDFGWFEVSDGKTAFQVHIQEVINCKLNFTLSAIYQISSQSYTFISGFAHRSYTPDWMPESVQVFFEIHSFINPASEPWDRKTDFFFLKTSWNSYNLDLMQHRIVSNFSPS